MSTFAEYLEQSALKLGQPVPSDENGDVAVINRLVKQKLAAAEACGDLAAELARMEVWVSNHIVQSGGSEKFLHLFGQVVQSYKTLERVLTERM